MDNATNDTPPLAELLLEELTHRINNELAALIAIVTRERAMDPDEATGRVLKSVHARLVNVVRIQHALQAHVARVTTLSASAASIAHEVNQPLSGIITNAATCLRMLAADPPNLEGACATAQRTLRDGNRASEVIQRMRALFSHRKPRSEPVDLNDAAREVLALTSSELQGNRVSLQIDLDASLPHVKGDRVQLQQVILNLIVNAADAMKTINHRPRQLQIATAPEAANQVRLLVRDSGVGIDPKDLEKPFEPFYTTKGHGMGIGLFISRSIVESHGGRLWATANDGPGATFSFTIPRESTTERYVGLNAVAPSGRYSSSPRPERLHTTRVSLETFEASPGVMKQCEQRSSPT